MFNKKNYLIVKKINISPKKLVGVSTDFSAE
jgi:hypothetical protein